MAVPTPPTITLPPTPPSRSDSVNFAARGDTFLGWFPTAWDYLNELVTWLTSRSTEVEGWSNTAQTAATSATASATSAGIDAAAVTAAVNSAVPNVSRFSGTGSQTAFNLSYAPLGKNFIDIYVGGQRLGQDVYTLNGSLVTITPAPVAGTNNIEVKAAATTTISYNIDSDYGLITGVPTSSADYGALV